VTERGSITTKSRRWVIRAGGASVLSGVLILTTSYSVGGVRSKLKKLSGKVQILDHSHRVVDFVKTTVYEIVRFILIHP
jgi:hypothetical protein